MLTPERVRAAAVFRSGACVHGPRPRGCHTRHSQHTEECVASVYIRCLLLAHSALCARTDIQCGHDGRLLATRRPAANRNSILRRWTRQQRAALPLSVTQCGLLYTNMDGGHYAAYCCCGGGGGIVALIVGSTGQQAGEEAIARARCWDTSTAQRADRLKDFCAARLSESKPSELLYLCRFVVICWRT